MSKVIWDSEEAFLPHIGHVIKGAEIKGDPKIIDNYVKQGKAKVQKDKVKEGEE